MKKFTYLLCFGCLVLLMNSCYEQEHFSLTGVTQKFTDGQKLYIRLGNDMVDSTEVVNNQFEFHTPFNSFPTRIILTTKGFEEYRFLWIEDKEMTFDASQSNFRQATVTGSETENLSVELMKSTEAFEYGDPEKIKVEQNFIKKYPNSVISANLLSIYASTWGKHKTEELYAFLSEELKNSSYGAEIKRYIDLAVEPKVGDSYVNFTMNDVAGNPVQLSDFEGKWVLLEFWASWCGPCRQENPNLVKTYEKYRDQGFEILGVSLDDDEESWRNAIEKDGLPWKQVSDLNGDQNEASIIYGVSGIPDNFLIDKNGKISYRNLRGEKLNNQLEELLSTPQ